MAETQKIVILNFGGQYTQLIARRVRECHVYSCVLPYDASLETIRAQNPVGVILSGGPAPKFLIQTSVTLFTPK